MRIKKDSIKKNNKNLYFFYTMIFLLVIIFLSVGFSAFQNNLLIESIISNVRIDKDIRVMNASVSNVDDAISYYVDYNVSNISGSVVLNNSNSYVIYDVDICNLGNVIMGISSASIDNENLKFEFLDYNLKDKICENNQCSLGVKKKLKIKVSYKDGVNVNNQENKFVLSFKFGKIFNISYYNISNSNNFPVEIIEGDTLKLNLVGTDDYHVKVFMNNKLLYVGKDYEYINNNLVISNVSGDIQIHYKMPICQRASVLHTEECLGSYCSGMGYKIGGSKGSATITYGSLGTDGVLTSGDAFDCDVNGDGVYDSETERFYYVNDLADNSDVAALIYYSNVSGGQPSSDKYYQYYNTSENWHGPLTAMEQLPTTSQWSNVKLFNTERKLVNEYGTTSSKDGHEYPKTLDYSKYAARLLTFAEVRKLVDFYIPSWKNGELDNYLYLAENTNFSKKDNSKFDGYWLENPRNTMSSYGWMIYTTTRRVHSVEVQRTDVLIGVRPVIEVAKSDISY